MCDRTRNFLTLLKVMDKTNQPERIELTLEQAELLKHRVAEIKEFTAEEVKLLVGLISFNFWLQQQLASAKLSLKKLSRLFGFRTEKKSPKIPK